MARPKTTIKFNKYALELIKDYIKYRQKLEELEDDNSSEANYIRADIEFSERAITELVVKLLGYEL
jgi:hypothetical protein